MSSHQSPITAQWAINRLVGLLVAIPFLAALGTAHAQNATWNTNPGSSDWNTNTNWTPQIVPTGRASFGSSNTTSVTLINAAVLVGTIQFNAGAPTYSFNIDGTIVLTGTGIINNSSNAPTFSAASGGLEFLNSTTAGNAVLITTGQGHMDFLDASTAGNAVITNSNNSSSEGTFFVSTSTAGNATITNNNGGFTGFHDASTAANAAIINNGGTTQFIATSTAGNATITTNGGFIVFLNTSTASNATITTNGGAAQFGGTSTAGNATIMTNNGGITEFFQTSTGGNARFITNAGGIFDMSGLTTAGMTAGSIEGAGTYNLGSKSLSAGGNNLSTEVSGVIADGGSGGGTGGSLVKAGTGTLTLSGANTYTGGTTISTGTLQLGNGGGTGSIVGNVIDNGIFAINRSDIFTFGGVISGTGSFEQRGAAGTTIFTGANTYTGGTTILRGTLQLGSGGATGSIVGNVVNNGTFNIFNANTGGITAITNNGGFTEFRNTSTAGKATINNINGGQTQFFDASTAGDATITTSGGSSGFSAFFNTSTAGNAKITINNSAILVFQDSSTAGNATITNSNFGFTEFLDTTASNAKITNNGGGTEFAGRGTAGNATITTNNGGITQFFNTSTGGNARFITTAGGIFDISSLSSGGMTAGSIEGVGLYRLGSKALTVGGNNLSTTVSGIIADGGFNSGGSLVKVGTGTLTLSGANTYTGGTTLNAGTIIVNNAQALGLGNVTVNGGILTADPQPINVKGNYSQGAGGTLQLQVAGKAAGQYDFLNVSGSASLGGTLQLLNLGYKPKAGDQLTLVTAGGTVSGKFSPFVDPFATGSGYNTVDLVYGKKSVLLEFLNVIIPVPPVGPKPPVITTLDFASFALTPNQFAAANLLDAVQLDPRASNLMSFLYKEPFGNLPSDFDKISPESLTAFYEISFSGANIQRLNLENRLEDIRNGAAVTASTAATVYLEDKADGKSSKNPPVLPPVREKRWDFWSTSFGDFVHVDSDFNAHGYKFTTGGIDLGIDYRLTNHLAFGLMGSYAHTWTDLRPGSIDVDSARGGLYATYFNKCFYINGGIYGGYNSYDSSRRGLQGHANGNSDGAEFGTFVGGGYDFHLGYLSIGPIASLQYTNVYVDSFREKSSLAPLSIHSDSEESLRSAVGFRASYQWQVGRVQVEPFLKATWQHEFKYSALPITASFANIPGPSATFVGPVEGHDSAVVDAGISVSWTPCISTYVSYNGLLGRDRYDSNGVSGGIRIRF